MWHRRPADLLVEAHATNRIDTDAAGRDSLPLLTIGGVAKW